MGSLTPHCKVFTAHQDLDYVLHTASPFTQKWTDAVKEVLDPAVQGTVEMLRSTKAHAPTVMRVVILSSFVTVMNPSGGMRVYDESMWNPVTWDAAVANPRLTYTGSKVGQPRHTSRLVLTSMLLDPSGESSLGVCENGATKV